MNNTKQQYAVERAPKKKKKSGTLGRVVRRTLLVLFTVVVLVIGGLCVIMNQIFNGPSPSACRVLTMSLSEASATKWVPALFIGQEKVNEIRTEANIPLPDDVTDTSKVEINKDTAISASDEWKDYPDGVRIEAISGDTYNAHIMIIRDPSQVYLATSTDKFARNIPGTRINAQIETEGAIAAINAGAFFDNGTAGPEVGSTPEGLVFSQGKCVWTAGSAPEEGFVGFDENNILVVSKTMTQTQGEQLKIRDGCCFGPVLVMNGQINEQAYNSDSGYNPRTCIGQRADGAVIFLCVDGRQFGSVGATYSDVIDILVEFGAVNACNLDGGSSSIMLYRDTYGRYGEAGKIQTINNYSLLQKEPRKMPTFFMVRPAKEA